MKKITALLTTIVLTLVVGTTAYAAGYGCQPIYGGGQTCVTQGNLLVNKTIQNPQTGDFVDNLTNSTDPRFNPDQNVPFQVSVINTGDATIAQTTVVDTLPSFLTFVSGPGNFDSNTRKLTFTIMNLNPGEKRVFAIMAKVLSFSNIPVGITCDPVNQVSATAENGQTSNDVSRFCIEKGQLTTKGGLPIFPVPQKQFTAPATGPEMLSLVGLIPAALGGFYLRRKTSK